MQIDFKSNQSNNLFPNTEDQIVQLHVNLAKQKKCEIVTNKGILKNR